MSGDGHLLSIPRGHSKGTGAFCPQETLLLVQGAGAWTSAQPKPPPGLGWKCRLWGGQIRRAPHRVRKAGTTCLGRAGCPLALELGQASPLRWPLCQGEIQPPGGPGRWPELAQLGGGKDGLFGGKAGECEPWSLVWPGPSRSMRRMC